MLLQEPSEVDFAPMQDDRKLLGMVPCATLKLRPKAGPPTADPKMKEVWSLKLARQWEPGERENN